ncbi:MAG: DUF1178 family protein [Alphaproteobacteria bacterium]
MIHYSLRCVKGHEFDAWFKDSAAYDRQAKAGHVSCAVCGSVKVKKAPMAPRIGKGAAAPAVDAEPVAASGVAAAKLPAKSKKTAVAGQMRAMLEDIRKHVEENADYVGDKFAEEARKIHYGETEERSIYGETSDDEAKALNDEGVPFARVPWMPRRNS